MSKKDFSKNPALQFVSGANQQKTDEIPEGYKRNTEFIQKKTRRVQLLMQEELYKKAKAHADAEGLSFNSYIHKILEEIYENNE